MATGRRFLSGQVRLTRRSWEDVAPELEGLLIRLWESESNGIPAGFNNVIPEMVEADVAGDPGVEGAGWAAADHVHEVITGGGTDLANANAEGTSNALARADHKHKRTVRVKKNGADVSTRNALNLIDGLIAWTVVDDGGNDEVDITPGLSAAAATISRGGTVITPTTPRNVIVWRAPFSCTVLAVKGYRVGGAATGTFINARRNGASDHLAANLELTSADTWIDGGAVQNTAYVAGDKLEIMLTALGAPLPSQVAIQVDLQRA